MAVAVSVVAIVMGTITVVTLISVWLGTSYSLKKRGYHSNQAKERYNQLQSDLRRLSADLEEIREHIADLIIIHHNRSVKTRCNQ
ncbi:hypothetical protein F4X33_02030 [Candidatus Poribacteria bacterium]|nr:hypothetical protein [Candidatus Poribacteria bacterium]